MKYLSLICAAAFFGNVLEATTTPASTSTTENAYQRGMTAGAVEASSYGGYYGPWDDENYNPFPDTEPNNIDNGEQIYEEDKKGL